jgi:hypothetical protein
MKKIILLFALLACVNANAKNGYGTSYFPGMEEFPTVRPVEHKKEIEPNAKPVSLLHDASKISAIKMRLITPQDPAGDNLQWEMDLPFRYIFLNRFATMQEAIAEYKEDDIWGRSYNYLEITFERTDGRVLPPYRLFRNSITVNNTTFVDTSKEIEEWIFSTVKNYKQINFVNKALNIDDYHRCKNIGNLYHETDPEQCLFPDGTVFLNLNTQIKEDTIRTFDFDNCFANRNPIIAGYPRRCIAPGGHVYTEQPKVK